MLKRNSDIKKSKQLGMPFGTAAGRLRKKILFQFVQKGNLDICFRCSKKIETDKELSIEHKIEWIDSQDPLKLFFDLDNISFSHQKCNSGFRKCHHKKYHSLEEKHKSLIVSSRKWRSDNKEKYREQRRDKYKRLGT
jgi:hypothetical protein